MTAPLGTPVESRVVWVWGLNPFYVSLPSLMVRIELMRKMRSNSPSFVTLLGVSKKRGMATLAGAVTPSQVTDHRKRGGRSRCT